MRTFFRKTIKISSMYLLPPFIVQNFKKTLRADPKLWGRAIFRSKMTRLPWKIISFRKPISKTCCVYSCLSTSKNSESDVNPLTGYWQLKNTKIWLAKSIYGHKLKTRFFSHMWFLQNAKGSWVLSFSTI